MNLYVARDGESLGPYNELQAREYLKTGIFTSEDLACPEGEEEWRPLASLLPAQRVSLAPKMTLAPAKPSQQPIVLPKERTSSIFPWVLAAFAVSALVAGWYFFIHDGTLKGEVFVVTKGGQNYRLGLVRVAVYPYPSIADYMRVREHEKAGRLQAIQDKLDALAAYDHSDEYYKLESEEEDIDDGRDLYRGLPQAEASTQTDADGKFSIPIPKHGLYLVAAEASRMTGERTEVYYWLVRESLNGSAEKTVLLSNNNMYPAQ